MSALKALEAQLREMTQCKICFEDKDHQKQLPCQHTICLDCVTKLKLENGKYKCPLCNKANLVPNGGFVALPDSLLTKQLSALLQTRDWESAAVSQAESKLSSTDISATEVSAVPQTEAGKKLRMGMERGKRSLQIAKQKMEGCIMKKTELKDTCEEIRGMLTKLKEEKIAELEKKTADKIEAAERVTKRSISNVESREAKLINTKATIEELIDTLALRADEVDAALIEEDVTNELRTASERLGQLEEEYTLSQEAADMKAGDSVRLKMIAGKFTDAFLMANLNYEDVGYILEIAGKEKCAVLFPGDSRFVGELSWLEKSPIKHTLPVVGDRVRVKPHLEKPFFGWGNVKKESIGILKEMTDEGPPAGRTVIVDFPEHNGQWKAIFNDLEVVPPEPLRVGEEVWIKLDISEPAGGWAGVTHNSKGTLLYSSCQEWRGLLKELERVRPISVGDKVKVLKSVDEPKTGWAGVTHKDEGVVKAIQDHQEHDKLAVIDFPNRPLLWKCIVSELELVERQAESGRAVVRRTTGQQTAGITIPQQIVDMSTRMTEQVMEQQCNQQ